MRASRFIPATAGRICGRLTRRSTGVFRLGAARRDVSMRPSGRVKVPGRVHVAVVVSTAVLARPAANAQTGIPARYPIGALAARRSVRILAGHTSRSGPPWGTSAAPMPAATTASCGRREAID